MSAGLAFTQQPRLSADATATADAPATVIWQRLADGGLTEIIEDGVMDLVRDVPSGSRGRALEQHGVSALDGLFASALAHLADEDPIRAQWAEDARRSIREFGTAEGSSLGLHTPLSDLQDGPLAVLRAAGIEPTVTIRIESGFRELRADQREDVIDLLADLANVCDCQVVVGRATQARLRRRYHDRLPVSDPCNGSPTGGALAERVEAARAELDPDGRPVEILQSLATESGETLTYHALYAMHSVTDGAVRQSIGALRDFDLVSSFASSRGAALELLAAGREFLDVLDSEIGVQQSITECVSETGQAVTDSRDYAHAREGRPNGEAGSATERAGDRHRLPHRHSVSAMARWHAAGTAAVARKGGVALVDRDWPEADDRGEASWSYDSTAGRVAVAAEYTNPMQGWVCVARALANDRTFRQVLNADAFEDADTRLGELFGDFRFILRESRCIGYLKDAATAEEFVEALKKADSHLCELTRRWRHGEFECSPEEYRSLITREALGLSSTIVHLLDLADTDVTVEWRVPDYRTWAPSDRRNLARSIARGAAIQSRYREFALHRQLFETRAEKRERAIRPTVDAADPLGECITSFVATGPGVSDPDKGADDRGDDLADLVHDEINNLERHDDAPDIQVHVPIDEHAGERRTATAAALQTVCATKHLSLTRETVSWFHAFAATPYDAARAATELGAETKAPGRRLAHHDVRYALSTLDADCILPEANPTIRSMCKTLFHTQPDESLTNAEVERRGGPSARSIRRHADALAAFGLLERTAAGWSLTATPPATTPDSLIDAVSDALAALAPERYTDPDDPVGAALFEPPGTRLPALREIGWLDPWITRIARLRDEAAPPGDPPLATFGDPLVQTAVAVQGAVGG